jgi:hypothetical protein
MTRRDRMTALHKPDYLCFPAAKSGMRLIT